MYSQVRDGNPKCHHLAVLSDSCFGVFVTKSMYITLKYSEQEKTIVSKEEVLNRLMSTPLRNPRARRREA
jgi:hypothetical protein